MFYCKFEEISANVMRFVKLYTFNFFFFFFLKAPTTKGKSVCSALLVHLALLPVKRPTFIVMAPWQMQTYNVLQNVHIDWEK